MELCGLPVCFLRGARPRPHQDLCSHFDRLAQLEPGTNPEKGHLATIMDQGARLQVLLVQRKYINTSPPLIPSEFRPAQRISAK